MTAEGERPGVLVMAYGTPAGAEQIEAYYTHIRRGRPPSAELLAELRGRYEAIGGSSPLLEITRAQVAAIKQELARAGGWDPIVALGMKHAPPFIEEGVARLVAASAGQIVGVVLAPHYSRMSVGEYEQRVLTAAQSVDEPLSASVVHNWHLAPDYLALLSREVSAALDQLSPRARAGAHVLFTAHSLPQRILADGDPYPDQLRETAAAVAGLAGLERWDVAWQSAGRTQEPWLGPDLLESMARLADAGVPGVVVCACGFVSDHLEVLYDLDIEAHDRAAALGLEFARTASPNDAPELASAVAGAVLEQLAVAAG
jgi:ferrochelatase